MIEIMVVVAIIAILAALAAPSLNNLLDTNRAAGAASAMQVSLNLARSEAIRRGGNARVTIAANGTTAGAWSNGWTVFADGTNNANNGVAPTADSAATATAGAITRVEVVNPISRVTFGQTGSLNYFMYNGMGRMIEADGSTVANRSFWVTSGSSDRFCLIVNITGRVRVNRVDPGATCSSDT